MCRFLSQELRENAALGLPDSEIYTAEYKTLLSCKFIRLYNISNYKLYFRSPIGIAINPMKTTKELMRWVSTAPLGD